MVFRIHFEVNGYEDVVTIHGETLEEIKEKADMFTTSRNIDTKTCWSEKIK